MTGIAVFIASVSLAVYFADISIYKSRVERAVSDALKMDVSIEGKLKITLFPYAGVSMEKLFVKNGGADFMSADRVRIGLELVPLFRREFRMNELEFVRPVVTVERDERGMFNFERQGQKEPRGGQSAFSFPYIRKAEIVHGRLIYSDKKSGAKTALKDIDLTIRNLSADKPGSGGILKHISFEGNFRCREMTAEHFRISDIAFPIKAKDGIFEIAPVTMTSYGAREEGSLKADLTGDVPLFTARYDASGYRLDKLSDALMQKKLLGGETEISLHLVTQGTDLKEMKRKLAGGISMSGDNLSLYSLDLDGLLSKVEKSRNITLFDAGAFLLAGPLGTAITKGYDYAGVFVESRGGQCGVRRLVSKWKIKNGTAETDDVALSTGKNRIAMKGKIDLVGERFENLTVAELDEKGCVRFSQKISGPFDDPHIEKVGFLTSIAAPVLNIFGKTKRILSGGKCEVFYAGSVLHPE